jgi:hypothetical protein
MSWQTGGRSGFFAAVRIGGVRRHPVRGQRWRERIDQMGLFSTAGRLERARMQTCFLRAGEKHKHTMTYTLVKTARLYGHARSVHFISDVSSIWLRPQACA